MGIGTCLMVRVHSNPVWLIKHFSGNQYRLTAKLDGSRPWEQNYLLFDIRQQLPAMFAFPGSATFLKRHNSSDKAGMQLAQEPAVAHSDLIVAYHNALHRSFIEFELIPV